MREMNGDLFKLAAEKVLVVTTNGTLNSYGEAIMGKGCALTAAKLFPTMPKDLAARITHGGNVVNVFKYPGYKAVLSFPTKNDWREPANLHLIMQSANRLKWLVDAHKFTEVYLPRPGCGAGKLPWDLVKAVLEPIFDDRFIVVDF